MANLSLKFRSPWIFAVALTLYAGAAFASPAAAHPASVGVTFDHGDRPGGGAEGTAELFPSPPPPGPGKGVHAKGGSLKQKVSSPLTPP